MRPKGVTLLRSVANLIPGIWNLVLGIWPLWSGLLFRRVAEKRPKGVALLRSVPEPSEGCAFCRVFSFIRSFEQAQEHLKEKTLRTCVRRALLLSGLDGTRTRDLTA